MGYGVRTGFGSWQASREMTMATVLHMGSTVHRYISNWDSVRLAKEEEEEEGVNE
jgi:hypothetical protein